jgi:hypothetical protein
MQGRWDFPQQFPQMLMWCGSKNFITEVNYVEAHNNVKTRERQHKTKITFTNKLRAD